MSPLWGSLDFGRPWTVIGVYLGRVAFISHLYSYLHFVNVLQSLWTLWDFPILSKDCDQFWLY